MFGTSQISRSASLVAAVLWLALIATPTTMSLQVDAQPMLLDAAVPSAPLIVALQPKKAANASEAVPPAPPEPSNPASSVPSTGKQEPTVEIAATPTPTAPLISAPAPTVASNLALPLAPPIASPPAPLPVLSPAPSTAAPAPAVHAVPKDEEIEKLIELSDIRTPQAWIRFFISAYFDRDYNTAEWCVEFEGTRYQTASLRRDCLYRLDYILMRLADTQWMEFPEDATSFDVRFRTKENIVDLSFTRVMHGPWRLASASVNQVDQLYHALYGKPPLRFHWIVQYLPEWMFRMYFGMSWFQWLFLISGAIGGLLVYWLVVGGFHIFVRIWMKVLYHREATLSRKAWTPLAVIAMVSTWYAVSHFFSSLPPIIIDTFHYATTTIVVAMTALMMVRVVDIIASILRRRGLGQNPSVDAVVIPLFSRSSKIIVIFSGLIVIAQTYHWEVLPLLSGMGIGGIAVAFAAKETLANLFGSITVLMDRPFIVGDWIICGGVEGTVESVGMRSTRIRTFYNSLVTIPNNNLTTATIDNMGNRHFRRYKTLLNIQYDTPPERIDAFCEGIRELIRRHPYTRKDLFHVYLHEFASTSLDVLLVVFFVCPDSSIEYRERGALIADILHLAADLGVSFAFPTQTIHMVPSQDNSYPALTKDPITLGRAVAAKWRPIDDE